MNEKKSKYCYFNGHFIPENKAAISVYDLGLLRGFGVFDFMRAKRGRLLLTDAHMKRLFRSARLINLKVPLTKPQIIAAINKLLTLNKLHDAYIRIVLTGGITKDGATYDYDKPTFFILVQAIPPLVDKIYEQGVKLITAEYQRGFARAKTTNYLTKLSLQKRKEKARAYEILYIHNGNVLECSTCNFYIFKNNTLITAKDNILEGTRRGLVLKLARKKFKVEERPYSLGELAKATEAFITSTTRDIVPVVRIDKKNVGRGLVGPNTKYLMDILNKYLKTKYSL